MFPWTLNKFFDFLGGRRHTNSNHKMHVTQIMWRESINYLVYHEDDHGVISTSADRRQQMCTKVHIALCRTGSFSARKRETSIKTSRRSFVSLNASQKVSGNVSFRAWPAGMDPGTGVRRHTPWHPPWHSLLWCADLQGEILLKTASLLQHPE